MTAFIPQHALSLPLLIFIIGFVFLVGFMLQRHAKKRYTAPAAWLLALGCPLLLEQQFSQEPPGFRMLSIIIPLYFGMKAVTAVMSAGSGNRPLTLSQWILFALAWPGMRARVFAQSRRHYDVAASMAVYGLLRIAAGTAVLIAAHFLVERALIGSLPTNFLWVAAALVLIGISLIMHFGLFGIAAAVLRAAGFDCRPLFRAPLKSITLSEFWSRRWNLAYSEMVSIAVQRPLAKRTAPMLSTLGAFACSGLFHEMAISWPVHRGYGLPMLYFLIQGVFVLLESRFNLQPLVQKGLTAAVIILPLPLLFHPWFLAGVVIPIVWPETDYFKLLPCIG